MGPHATIRDRANVILTTIKPPMHWIPKLYPITLPLETVLHIWIETVACSVKLEPRLRGSARYRIVMEPQYVVYHDTLDEQELKDLVHYVGDLDEGPHYDLLCPCDTSDWILVDRRQDPTERIAIFGIEKRAWTCTLKPEVKYVRMR